jgi:hypothetical protein
MWAIMGTAVDPRGNRDWAPYAIGPIVGALLAAALLHRDPPQAAGADRAATHRHTELTGIVSAA